MPVDPTGQDLKRYLAEDEGGEVVMLNLLRFRAEGRASYESYAREIVPHLERVGGSVVYAGDCATSLVPASGTGWDAVLLVRYPSRAAFCAMVADEEYQRITHLRTEALEEAVLQATSPWGAGH
ncbi:DUF1330 domain-containing protein [Aeromicrobium sp. CTD01-1L150]|uniref:DUF1330 domain-containing protein n=1 Tax=Aeromicrobium sp. CTD01-1L150 TaxID=3341830 RepID=UPI0035C22CC3